MSQDPQGEGKGLAEGPNAEAISESQSASLEQQPELGTVDEGSANALLATLKELRDVGMVVIEPIAFQEIRNALLQIIALTIAIVFGVFSILTYYLAVGANGMSATPNDLSSKSNRLAIMANRAAEEANRMALAANQLALLAYCQSANSSGTARVSTSIHSVFINSIPTTEETGGYNGVVR